MSTYIKTLEDQADNRVAPRTVLDAIQATETGLIKGNGTNLEVAIPGVDYTIAKKASITIPTSSWSSSVPYTA